jgi:hypothetical protein
MEFRQTMEDVLYLGVRPDSFYNIGPKLNFTTRLSTINFNRRRSCWFSTFGYVVKAQAYATILHRLYPINVPFDVYLGKLILDAHLHGLVVNPEFMIYEDNDGIHDTII